MVLLGAIFTGSFHMVPYSKQGLVMGSDQKRMFVAEAEKWLGKSLEEDFLKTIQNKSAFNYVMVSKMEFSETVFSTNTGRIVLAPFWIPQERTIVIKDANIHDRLKGWFKS